jgi:hypothetical protein
MSTEVPDFSCVWLAAHPHLHADGVSPVQVISPKLDTLDHGRVYRGRDGSIPVGGGGMAAARSENRGGWGCVSTAFGTVALACLVEVIVQDAASEHPGFFVNLPGWAEASAFVSGFLTVMLTLVWFGLYMRFSDRRRGMVWLTSLLIAPVLIVCGGFAFQTLPPRYDFECGDQAEAQTCAYIHAHPFVVLALFAGGILAVALLAGRSVYKSNRMEDPVGGETADAMPASGFRYADPDIRSAAARWLIARAEAEGEAALGLLLGMDLCVLGGPMRAFFPRALIRAWARRNQAVRNHFTTDSVRRMEGKRQLLRPPGEMAVPSPELGIIVEALSHPAYVVIAHRQSRAVPELSVFGLASKGEPVPLAVAGLRVTQRAEGPSVPSDELGCSYEYRLVSEDRAASLLAEYSIQPAGKPGHLSFGLAWVLTRYSPSGDQPRMDSRVSVRGDGTTARAAGLDHSRPKATRNCDRGELETVMAGLLSRDLYAMPQ